jgi:hypothetical protein
LISLTFKRKFVFLKEGARGDWELGTGDWGLGTAGQFSVLFLLLSSLLIEEETATGFPAES